MRLIKIWELNRWNQRGPKELTYSKEGGAAADSAEGHTALPGLVTPPRRDYTELTFKDVCNFFQKRAGHFDICTYNSLNFVIFGLYFARGFRL